MKMTMKLFGAAFFILHSSFFILLSSFFISCTKEETEADEWDNWQVRNEAYFASLADSLRSNPAQWQRIKKYSLDPATEGKATDYVYVKVLGKGNGGDTPAFTDSVRVMYRGSLIPTTTYPQGFVFDSTVSGTFDIATGNTVKMVMAGSTGTIDGFSTALQHMHRGDHWKIYIPSDLGYGDNGYTNSSGTTVIQGHSVLIFEMILVDFSPAGETMAPWSSRKR